ncbi:MAG: hypothetical protein QT08_C0001G0003 [archaeon GW2011_AR17]|nr:MAG: hypothetical protein QT08_C0001G0003 [archaeon GW2011_AR17]MBS3153887.1 DUF2073 domain-containing protein [Candidatus Woesearchaeota archaeon]HIH15488.1 DUF2073 domain-containing protein [Nanoarchaeota archaeon]HIH59291.1 DUF2073 domain-containing protein [Nanoarchaeota archaeon]HII13914.1 DUF2073 domain-containing protein [Nanoarchaeota archaeon]
MLTLQYIPFNEIENLSSERRIAKLMAIVKKNKIILMQGRLKATEEAGLIEKTMEEVNREFKGIELCTIYPTLDKNGKVSKQIKQAVVKMLMGDREGLTIIGPATVVKEIKRNPDKIELLTHNLNSRKNLGGK